MKEIGTFSGKYRFLSNFYPCEIMLDGLKYSSVEAAYQASKTDDAASRRKIREEEKPAGAKKLGQNVKLRPGWEEMKLQVMEDLVWQKFTEHADLREKLLATGDAELIEGNNWSDRVWGVCRGKGQNHLGKILMKIREELR